MTSILIPAFNEANVIARTLRSVIASAGEREIEIVVVCNACKDATAQVARSIDDSRIQVIETERPGKCHAINLGERYLKSYPRIYLDADIEVSSTFVEDMTQALRQDQPRGAWPSVKYDLNSVSSPVSAFYRVWTNLPYNQPGRIGVGAYAMNAAGRQRFTQFPEIISDDGFVRGLFTDEERIIVSSCHTIVRAPRNLQSLIAVRTRSRIGVYELLQKHPEIMQQHFSKKQTNWSQMAPILLPRVVASMPMYALVVVLTKLRARKRLHAQQLSSWDQDLTARQ
jgi:glycosyltransferase involved in cell wall biosynthesis